MIFTEAAKKLNKFNKYCLHYNLVAQAAYEKLKKADSPFSIEYRSFIIAALISFDMGRMMGSGLVQKYDPRQAGFALKLELKMKAIQPDIEPLSAIPIANVKIDEVSQSIKKSYLILS